MPCPTLRGRKARPVDHGDKNKVGTSRWVGKMAVGAFQGESGMVRLVDLPPAQGQRLAALDCPQFTTEPWVTGPPLAQRRVRSSPPPVSWCGAASRFAAVIRTTIRSRRAPRLAIC